MVGCSEPDCGNEIQSRGLCNKHYQRAFRAGQLGGKICREVGCTKTAVNRGLCDAHYYIAKRDGTTPGIKCSKTGCGAIRVGRGLCQAHYYLARKSGEIFQQCSVAECKASAVSGGKCGRHYQRFRKYKMTDEDQAVIDKATSCALCPASATDVDHDHKTGKVRGTLCNRHNQALGLFADDIETMKAAIAYLEANRQSV